MDISYKINDLRELLELIEEVLQTTKDYGKEYLSDLIEDLKATSGTLIAELEKIGQNKELDYAGELLEGIYPEKI